VQEDQEDQDIGNVLLPDLRKQHPRLICQSTIRNCLPASNHSMRLFACLKLSPHAGLHLGSNLLNSMKGVAVCV
jgi:hypothetical protein